MILFQFSTALLQLSMEVVSSAEIMQNVYINTLSEIPSETQIIQAISILYTEKEKSPCIAMKFPFGILCYDGLKEMRSYYEQIQCQNKINEDQDWLKKVKKFSSQLGINVYYIEEYFQDHVWISKPPTKDITIQSFVGNCWLTNYDIDTFFEIININCDNFIGFVYNQASVELKKYL